MTTAESNAIGFRFATPNQLAHRIDSNRLFPALVLVVAVVVVRQTISVSENDNVTSQAQQKNTEYCKTAFSHFKTQIFARSEKKETMTEKSAAAP